jgi:protein-disulfide isomerase/peroxiredoxin
VERPVDRPWALKLLLVVLALAAGIATYLGWAHIQLAHGSGAFESLCAVGETFDCDKVNTSAWSELMGLPISLWALPVYGAMAVLAVRGRQGSERGRKARGALTLLSGWNVLVSIFLGYISATQVGAFCLFCMSLYALHLGALVLAILSDRDWKPALPEIPDLGWVAGVLAVLTAVVFGVHNGIASQLDGQVIAAIEARTAPVGGAALADPAIESRKGGKIRLPTERKDVVVRDFDHSWGPADAAVTVVEFADFECGYCRRLSHVMHTIREKYVDRVRFVFKHFPMDRDCNSHMRRTHHKDACEAAMAARCAGSQGAFEAYHDLLFRNQEHLDADDLRQHAKDLGLDLASFEACQSDPAERSRLQTDIDDGAAMGITGTPRTYVNGLEFKGALSEAVLDAAIRVALGEVEANQDGAVQTRRDVVVDKPLLKGPVVAVPIQMGDRTFWMDAVEASIDSDGRAQSLAAVLPGQVSWYGARSACEAAGKRLCTAQEWRFACTGAEPVDGDASGSILDDFLEGRLYPYGDYHRANWCYDGGSRERSKARPTGRMPGCRSPEGLYDLTGNVAEWVGSQSDDATLMGGHFYLGDKAHCGAVYDVFGAGLSNPTTGFRCCSDTANTTPIAVAEDTRETQRGVVGGPLPWLQGPGPGGGLVSSDLLTGKVGLVNFWASWCGPCQKELPALARLQRELGNEDFQVLAVNVDRRAEDAKRVLSRGRFPFAVLMDPEARILGLFDVASMPTSVLVDRDGQIVDVHTGYSEKWMKELQAQVEKLIQQ